MPYLLRWKTSVSRKTSMYTRSRENAKLASLMKRGDSVLVQLTDTLSLGRLQSVRASGKVPRNESTDVQWNSDPRMEIALLVLGRKSRRNVSLRVSRGLGLVPIQFAVPRWNPGVGSGYALSSPTPLGLSRLLGITLLGNGWPVAGSRMTTARP